MKCLSLSGIVCLVLCGCNDADRPSTPTVPGSPTAVSVDKDNTTVNQRDREADAKTPLDQNENQSDISITAKIRKEVVDTKMSVNAQNVKIITQDGLVTLRGPVKSDEEKKQIDTLARSVAGADKVDNQLEVEKHP